jgi:hypothetical protein
VVVNNPESVLYQPEDVNPALTELGLTTEILQEAVGQAALARLEVTPHSPRTAGGSMQWFAGVASLRDQLVPLGGWEPINEDNQGLVFNRKSGIVLAVAGGDADTGISTGLPTTRSKKGPRMKEAIDRNQIQMFPEYFRLPISERIRNLGTLWLLLVHVSLQHQQVRAELSRPVRYAHDRRPSEFMPRIILAPIDLDETFALRRGGPSAPQGQEITVEIRRRA